LAPTRGTPGLKWHPTGAPQLSRDPRHIRRQPRRVASVSRLGPPPHRQRVLPAVAKTDHRPDPPGREPDCGQPVLSRVRHFAHAIIHQLRGCEPQQKPAAGSNTRVREFFVDYAGNGALLGFAGWTVHAVACLRSELIEAPRPNPVDMKIMNDPE
jgi:hypothetical protein